MTYAELNELYYITHTHTHTHIYIEYIYIYISNILSIVCVCVCVCKHDLAVIRLSVISHKTCPNKAHYKSAFCWINQFIDVLGCSSDNILTLEISHYVLLARDCSSVLRSFLAVKYILKKILKEISFREISSYICFGSICFIQYIFTLDLSEP